MAHRIRQGECVSVIAARNGMGWRRIWDAAENQPLHEAGRHPNVLLPGDALHVPKLELGVASAPTDQHHRFVLHGTSVTVHIKLVADLEPLPDEPWVIEHPGGTVEGTSDGEGMLEARLPALLEQATLLLPKRRFRYTLLLGALDPLETPSGARARLRNLGLGLGGLGLGPGGLGPGGLEGDDDELAEELRDFQRAQALDESAELDDATLDALRDEYGI